MIPKVKRRHRTDNQKDGRGDGQEGKHVAGGVYLKTQISIQVSLSSHSFRR
jgi:hypothetical protein